ncbi:MAG: alpha/beta hydrolase [Gammaproteobacteria bacterium]|jgi:dienelactone hydrolase
MHISIDGVTLHGSLNLNHDSRGLVVFVQGVGSGRFSPRNRYIADHLNTAGVSTLLIDLLTPSERNIIRSHDRESNINWLRNRLNSVMDWLLAQNETSGLSFALFGSNLGAAAALKTAAERKREISAVVVWSGRPDLVKESLPDITAPTLLVAGSYDQTIVDANREAAEQFRTNCYLEIIPDAGHELKESGKLEELAHLCNDWLLQVLPNSN